MRPDDQESERPAVLRSHAGAVVRHSRRRESQTLFVAQGRSHDPRRIDHHDLPRSRRRRTVQGDQHRCDHQTRHQDRHQEGHDDEAALAHPLVELALYDKGYFAHDFCRLGFGFGPRPAASRQALRSCRSVLAHRKACRKLFFGCLVRSLHRPDKDVVHGRDHLPEAVDLDRLVDPAH